MIHLCFSIAWRRMYLNCQFFLSIWWIHHSLLIHLLTEDYLSGFQFLTIKNKAAIKTHMCRYLCGHKFSNQLGYYLGAWFSYDMVKLCIYCWSGTKPSPTLCDPMDCSTPGFPVLHNSQNFLKFMFIESVMPLNHLTLCRPLLLLPPILPSIGLFQWVGFLHHVVKILELQLQHQSFQWIFKIDLF